jgi:hypothetical protein
MNLADHKPDGSRSLVSQAWKGAGEAWKTVSTKFLSKHRSTQSITIVALLYLCVWGWFWSRLSNARVHRKLEPADMVVCDTLAYGVAFFLAFMWVAESRFRGLLLVVARVGLWVCLAAAIPIFFEASNVVVRAMVAARPNTKLLYDDVFLSWDEALLGAFFPRGQFALWLDTSAWLGPTTFLGMVLCEVLQVAYASYYLWGNGLGLYLLYLYLQQKYSMGSQFTPELDAFHWTRLKMYISAWSGGFLFNFILNSMFPAVSPRIFLAGVYQNELQGLWLANILRGGLANAAANSYSAFPSGHCGLSWLAALLAHRLGFVKYSRAALGVGLLITLATQVLRYHYFVDMLCATLLVTFGMVVGGFETQAQTDSLLTQTGVQGRTDALSGASISLDVGSEDSDERGPLMGQKESWD